MKNKETVDKIILIRNEIIKLEDVKAINFLIDRIAPIAMATVSQSDLGKQMEIANGMSLIRNELLGSINDVFIDWEAIHFQLEGSIILLCLDITEDHEYVMTAAAA